MSTHSSLIKRPSGGNLTFGLKRAEILSTQANGGTATLTGDAEIETSVALPRLCFAPNVFVTSPTGAWFAVSGR